MTQKERLEIIRDLLSARPFVSLGELEKMFPEVTSMTLRRDIDRLEGRAYQGQGRRKVDEVSDDVGRGRFRKASL